MKREDWKVPYSNMELAKAAEKKIGVHNDRRARWLKKKTDLIEEIKNKGITVTESVVDELMKMDYSNATRAFGGPTVQIDAGLQSQLIEATRKVHEHIAKRDEYRAWHAMMTGIPGQQFELDHDDWMFFFGGSLEPQ
jgi:hypothetical protein